MWTNIIDQADREENVWYCGCCEYGAWWKCFRRNRRISGAVTVDQDYVEQNLGEHAQVQEPVVIEYQGCSQWIFIALGLIIYLFFKSLLQIEEVPLLEHFEH